MIETTQLAVEWESSDMLSPLHAPLGGHFVLKQVKPAAAAKLLTSPRGVADAAAGTGMTVLSLCSERDYLYDCSMSRRRRRGRERRQCTGRTDREERDRAARIRR
ncbi:MAG TPA: hypothetical protein VL598_07410, partial [Trinickia sp.]|uniref:hypothetical protein n=1 Tax=Trinickia sp. TaxID=2571163 RepID=UPI002C029D0A